jgi:hypothetical protein
MGMWGSNAIFDNLHKTDNLRYYRRYSTLALREGFPDGPSPGLTDWERQNDTKPMMYIIHWQCFQWPFAPAPLYPPFTPLTSAVMVDYRDPDVVAWDSCAY